MGQIYWPWQLRSILGRCEYIKDGRPKWREKGLQIYLVVDKKLRSLYHITDVIFINNFMTLNSVKCFLNEMTGIQSYPTLTDKTILDCTQKAAFIKKKKLISQSEWQDSSIGSRINPALCLKGTEGCTARCPGGCPVRLGKYWFEVFLAKTWRL